MTLVVSQKKVKAAGKLCVKIRSSGGKMYISALPAPVLWDSLVPYSTPREFSYGVYPQKRSLCNGDDIGGQPVEGQGGWEAVCEDQEQWREDVHQRLASTSALG